MIPTSAGGLRRASPRGLKPARGITQQQKAQARLAQQFHFIDKPAELTPAVRRLYVDRFKSPLGKLTSSLAVVTGVHSSAVINLPDKELSAIAAEDATRAD